MDKMTPFTDNDLIRLKVTLAIPLGLENKPMKSIVSRLLARLEAAEKHVVDCVEYHGINDRPFYKAWRKASGK